jgi:hypothetical protein
MENQKEKTVTIKIELDTTDVQKKLDEIDKRIRNSDAFKELSDIATLPPQKIISDITSQKIISDALTEMKSRWYEIFGSPSEDKTTVAFLVGEWIAIEGEYTPDKIRLREHGLSEQDLENASASRQGFEQHTAGGTASVSYTMNIGINRDKPVQSTVTMRAPKFKVNYGVDTNLEALIENAVKNHAQSAARDIKKQLAADRMTLKDLTSHIKNVMLLECFPGGILHRNFGSR